LSTIGADVAIFTVGALDLVGLFTNVRFTGETEMVEAMTVLDVDSYGIGARNDATLDFSKVVESTLPLMALANSADPRFVAVIRRNISGPQISGTFGITSAKWTGGNALQSEDVSSQVVGPLTITTPTTSTPPTKRTTQADTKIGKDITTLTLGVSGSEDSYLAVFKDCSIETAIEWADATATKDDWHCRRPISRKSTLTVSKVNQTGGGDGAFLAMWAARTAVNFAVTAGADVDTFSGAAYPRSPGFELTRGPVDETLTLDIQGALSIA
jgi:hypothetical protein